MTRISWAAVMAVAAAAACAGCERDSARPPEATRPKQDLVDPGVPDGYRPLRARFVADVGAPALLLIDSDERVMLPIFVGESEAHAIALRIDREKFARPLTHDLIDSLLAAIDGRILRTQVDELRGDVFIGSLHLRAGDRYIRLDARPSDAIALAVGADAPIFVAQEVIDRASLAMDELAAPAPPTTADPDVF